MGMTGWDDSWKGWGFDWISDGLVTGVADWAICLCLSRA